jgi:hypothetical protein
MRIVRICAGGSEHNSLGYIWKPIDPLPAPSLCDSDIAALYQLQRESFTPTSTIRIAPTNGHLIAIRVYSQLGARAGINAIQFVYDTGLEPLWGCADDAASLSFFLDKEERLIEATIYKVGSVVYHIQVRRHTCYQCQKLTLIF